jgi:hypothetical protein
MSYYKQTHREKEKRRRSYTNLYEFPFVRVSTTTQPMVFTCWDVSEIPQEGGIDAVYFLFLFTSSSSAPVYTSRREAIQVDEHHHGQHARAAESRK